MVLLRVASVLPAEVGTRSHSFVYPAFTTHFSRVLVEGVEGSKRVELLAIDAGTVGTGAVNPVRIGCERAHD